MAELDNDVPVGSAPKLITLIILFGVFVCDVVEDGSIDGGSSICCCDNTDDDFDDDDDDDDNNAAAQCVIGTKQSKQQPRQHHHTNNDNNSDILLILKKKRLGIVYADWVVKMTWVLVVSKLAFSLSR
jgi:hypothetical protein